MSSLSKEQELALERALGVQRKTNIYESRETVIDETTGQIISQATKTITKSESEPDFIKLYYSTMLAFNGVNDIPLEFIIALSSSITWANENEPMVFRNDKFTKESFCQKLNIKESMVTKYIKRCCDYGLLVSSNYRGLYYVNPFFIAKGKWENIKKLRSEFSYTDGTWAVKIESKLLNDNTKGKKVG